MASYDSCGRGQRSFFMFEKKTTKAIQVVLFQLSFRIRSLPPERASLVREHTTLLLLWLSVVLEATPPPLAQAWPWSQQSGQNGGSTPNPCLDKAVHARDTRDRHAGNNIVSHG